MKNVECEIPEEQIAQRAYELWQERGCPEGDGSQDWEGAKAELIAARISRNGSTQHRLRRFWDRLRGKAHN
jgi:hypothetical protein